MALVGARTRTEQRVLLLVVDVVAIPREDRLGVMGGVDVPRRSNVGGLEWHLVRPRTALRMRFLLMVLRNHHLGAGLLWIIVVGQMMMPTKWVDFDNVSMVLRLTPHCYQCWISQCFLLDDFVLGLLRVASGVFVSVVVSLIMTTMMMVNHYFCESRP